MGIKVNDRISPLLQAHLQSFGNNLKAARKRRKWTIEKVRTDIGCSKGTLEDAEKGKPSVSLGVYILLLDLYGFDLNLITTTESAKDTIGQSLSSQSKLSSKSTTETKISPADF